MHELSEMVSRVFVRKNPTKFCAQSFRSESLTMRFSIECSMKHMEGVGAKVGKATGTGTGTDEAPDPGICPV